MADFICLAVASQYPEHHTTTVESSTPTVSSSSFRRSLNAATILGRRLSRSSESVHPNETSNCNTTTTTTTNSNVSMHVRIVPSIDNPRRSLIFDIVDRELKGGTVVKIGRFTDRSITTNHISFKSKVVSRTHCELWVDAEDGKLYIRDTKSSSGTFVNHGRLSAANQESRPVEVHDGDIVQLGVDYQGGVEEMYRAVKMRFELNRRPQPLINSSTLTQFVKKEEDHGHSSSSAVDECCICLYAMAPFQALFIAPCCHSYHFKCIRPLLESYPGFQCPLCRTYSDLEASVEEPALPVTEDQPQQLQQQQQEEEQQQQQQQVIAASCTTEDDDIQVVDQRESGDLHHQHQQPLQPEQQQQHHPEEHEQSPFHHHNQPDPLDTTLVLSPSNLSGILSNPSSPSGQDHERHARAMDPTTTTTTPNSRRNSEHNQRRNTATNFVDKLKMAFSSAEKRAQQQQQQQQKPHRRSTIRPLSYPNLWRRDDSENEDDESDDRPQAAGSSPSSSSCASPSSSPPHPSAGLLTRTLSAQSSSNGPAVHLADIIEEASSSSSTHELSRPVTMS